MDPITQQAVLATAGAGGGDPVYVDEVFSTYLYYGTGTAQPAVQTIANGLDLSGEGGLTWIKGRTDPGGSGAFGGNINNIIIDTESGAVRTLSPNSTNAGSNFGNAPNGGITFTSNGFQVGYNGYDDLNYAGGKYCSWSFRKAPGFFDVVTYTGNGTSRSISHSLGSTPGMIIIKSTSTTADWIVYHRSLGATKGITLNSTASAVTSGAYWNDTAPTSSAFTVNTNGYVNQNGETYVAYVFAHDDASFGTSNNQSIIKCGSYTGNGNVAGPTIDLGFEPQYVLIKGDYASTNWQIADSMRGVHTGGTDSLLLANSTDAEVSGNNRLDFTSTGFNIVNGAYDFNANNATYIYMAIRRPHKPPTAGTEVLAASTNTTAYSFNVGFPADMVLSKATSDYAFTGLLTSRLTNYPQKTADSSAELGTNYMFHFDLQNDFKNAQMFGGTTQVINYSFKRAPGFFDVVAYTGTGSNQNITHNLGVVPELMIIKGRNVAVWWMVYTSVIDGSHDYLQLQDTVVKGDSSLSLPTSTSIILDTTSSLVNGGYNYISYLFATLPGISKVGTYTGTGNAINVDCGFTAGARFALIKRTDVIGDWYVFDSARGIVSGNDPYLLMNSTAIDVTNTDYIDPLNAGFTVTSSAPAGLNASGGTYLFLAIA